MNFVEAKEFIYDNNFIVCIDPGHGGMVDNKYTTAPSKMYDHGDYVFYEGVFNREVSIKLARELRRAGISYMYTTTSNEDESLPERVYRANKRLDEFTRGLFVSIHGNAAGTERARGIEVFTSIGHTESDIIADKIYWKLNEMGWTMRSDLSDGDVDKESKFYVLRKTMMPAVLIECGFFTNRKEAMRMMREDVQNDIARLICEGIQDYLT